MGSRTSDTLKEIEDLRRGLDAKVSELEKRMPPLAKLGRRAVAMAAGGSVGSTVLLWGVKRARASRKERKQTVPVLATPASATLLPKGALPVAVAAIAVWAGVRILEARMRSAGEPQQRPRPAVVTPLPEGRSAAWS